MASEEELASFESSVSGSSVEASSPRANASLEASAPVEDCWPDW